MKGYLLLSDGTKLDGIVIGNKKNTIGEVVFNTGMTGYQEIITDPSYYGQIVVLTYPMIGNYGVKKIRNQSNRVQVKGLIIRECETNESVKGSFANYLVENNIVAIEGIDTRYLTKKIRNNSTLTGQIVCDDNENVAGINNYVNSKPAYKVSTKNIYELGKGKYTVAVYDFGIKSGIIKQLLLKNFKLIIFPANTSASTVLSYNPDGVFLSNGPGDPEELISVIKEIKEIALKKPVFGICLGHQLLALAFGGKTKKLSFGHRGSNHPVKDIIKNRVFITSQNHGFVVEESSLVGLGLEKTHYNVNDESLEGFKHTKLPIFSVQYHPEASPGPDDSNYLFAEFEKLIEKSLSKDNSNNKKHSYKKVLVIGSGPIVIGQAAEFDYSGTQACKVLKEEGISVVLLNNNPATIMTDKSVADSVYSEPLNLEFLKRIIIKEKPDAILPGMGGQTALNLSMELNKDGILEEMNIDVIGTSIAGIEKAEDREKFKKVMDEINEPCTESFIANSIEEAKLHASNIGYPIVVRPAFTLGGTGGGFCYNDEDLNEIVSIGLQASIASQVLIEKSIKGWKEIEYEMMRDHSGNTIVVCNMENFDPVGVHTGDSIVVAPSQTLSDFQYQMLRTASIKIVDTLGIIGGCNVQIALNPKTSDYYIIEVNPRVSRSSALASKATGYPIAKVATKIALGYDLDEIVNDVTKKTKACYEPALDYCVLKIPKWPFNKFKTADRKLGTQMKATGEVMSIGNNFESAVLKGIRSLEINQDGLVYNKSKKMLLDELFDKVIEADDERIFHISELLRREVSVLKIARLTDINKFFLNKLKNIVDLEKKLTTCKLSSIDLEFMRKLKVVGFSDKHISDLIVDGDNSNVREYRKEMGVIPSYKMVDTCAGEFDAKSPYYYSTYDLITENEISTNKKILIIGSGPISIGQGVEFDYCSVHGSTSIQKLGLESILINNNPETVSTDFDISDKLYFEPITIEDVMNVIDIEEPIGVILQYGGQTAIKLASDLNKFGVNILGTDFNGINMAEDRNEFNNLIDNLGVNRPKGETVNSIKEAIEVSKKLKYPILVRPSYVIGGEGMLVVYNNDELLDHLNTLENKKNVLLDQYIEGIELEVDCITDGKDILIPGIMEHLEKSGVHSGDSISIYPTQNIKASIIEKIVEDTKKICVGIKGSGMINIQYIYARNKIFVIEVNPRASRTVPFLSKVTNIPMIEIATRIMLNEKLSGIGYGTGLVKSKDFVAIKFPVFSMEKINHVDIMLNPEMKSTGEILSIGKNFNSAMKKGMISLKFKVDKKTVLMTISDLRKKEALNTAKKLVSLGYKIYATKGTKDYLSENGINSILVNKIGENNSVIDLIKDQKVDMVINIPKKGQNSLTDGFKLRRVSVERNIICYTSLDTINAKLDVLISKIKNSDLEIIDICKI